MCVSECTYLCIHINVLGEQIICLCIIMLFWSLGLGWAGQRCLGPQKYEINKEQKVMKHTWNIYEMMFIFWGVLPATWKYEANLKKNVNKYKHIICKLLFWSLGLGWAGQRCLGPQKYGKRINKKTTHNTKHTLLCITSIYAQKYMSQPLATQTHICLCIEIDISTTHINIYA